MRKKIVITIISIVLLHIGVGYATEVLLHVGVEYTIEKKNSMPPAFIDPPSLPPPVLHNEPIMPPDYVGPSLPPPVLHNEPLIYPDYVGPSLPPPVLHNEPLIYPDYVDPLYPPPVLHNEPIMPPDYVDPLYPPPVLHNEPIMPPDYVGPSLSPSVLRREPLIYPDYIGPLYPPPVLHNEPITPPDYVGPSLPPPVLHNEPITPPDYVGPSLPPPVLHNEPIMPPLFVDLPVPQAVSVEIPHIQPLVIDTPIAQPEKVDKKYICAIDEIAEPIPPLLFLADEKLLQQEVFFVSSIEVKPVKSDEAADIVQTITFEGDTIDTNDPVAVSSVELPNEEVLRAAESVLPPVIPLTEEAETIDSVSAAADRSVEVEHKDGEDIVVMPPVDLVPSETKGGTDRTSSVKKQFMLVPTAPIEPKQQKMPEEKKTTVSAALQEKRTNVSNSTEVKNEAAVFEKDAFYVQIGRFFDFSNAEKIRVQYEKEYPIIVEKITVNSHQMYSVYVGPLRKDEKGAVLETFNTYGFHDVFVKTK